ncbi:amino acid transporter [Bimuria novae-zelandiae CBS 107.79]|uniref:Amino acid transporter n=1 Tax=Bimuria novae-zelandiae CBS 107.79 TaxID=1447943 RepID=A0A6A5UJN3_9PLEO|nr:amino acid transporter [Bimuria novae-zelandiae CBS 107.79]
MGEARPLDRKPYYVYHFEHLHRVLGRPQLTGIGISGGVGVGVFVASGSLITASGSLGGPLSYLVGGIIAACALYTFTEMVACRPLTGSLIDLPHKFLDPAAGFAVAVSYSLGNILSMACLTAYSAEMTALLKPGSNPERHPPKVEVGITVAFVALTTLTHCLGVRLYGAFERIVAAFKLCLFVLVCILMLVINVGAAGQRTGSYRSNYTTMAFPPGFKPAGFNSTSDALIRTEGVPDTHFGIPGSSGRLFGFLTSVTFAMFSCYGQEIIAMTAGEAREPFKDVPVVMSFVYLVPLTLMPLTLISAAANVNYTDPSLAFMWSPKDGTLSPFVVAVQTSAIAGVAKALHLFFIVSAYTAANTELYVASRSVFMLAQTYLPGKIADVFGRTNNGHTPLSSILLCSLFGFVSLAGLSRHAHDQPRETLSAFFTGSIACVYICECVTFLKFKAGLERLEQRQILSRNDPLYISRMFKSRWQPLPAYVGMIGCIFVVVWSGVPPLFILRAKSGLTSTDHLKSNLALACDVLGAYSGPFLFAVFYLTYKYITPRSFAVDVRDLTPGDYVLGDLAAIEGENPTADGEPEGTKLEAQRWSTASPGTASAESGMSSDMQEQYEMQRANEEARRQVVEILERRAKRMERSLLRELWSCVVADKD